MDSSSSCLEIPHAWPPLQPNQVFEAADFPKLPLAPAWKLLLGADCSPTRGFAVLSGYKTIVSLLEDTVLPASWVDASRAAADAPLAVFGADESHLARDTSLRCTASKETPVFAPAEAPAEAVRHFGGSPCVRRRVLLRNEGGLVYGYAVSWWSVEGYRRVMADASRPIGGNMANARLEVHRDISQVYRCCAAAAPLSLANALGRVSKDRCPGAACSCECTALRTDAPRTSRGIKSETSAVDGGSDVTAGPVSRDTVVGGVSMGAAAHRRDHADPGSSLVESTDARPDGSEAETAKELASPTRPSSRSAEGVCPSCCVWGRHYTMWNGGAPLAVICEVFSPACQTVLGPYQLLKQ